MSALDRPTSWLRVVGFEVCLGSEVEVLMVMAFFEHLPPAVACLGTIYNSLVVLMVLLLHQVERRVRL